MSQSQPFSPATADPPSRPREWDEMVSGAGSIRPAWRALVGALHAFPEGTLAERAESAARLHDEMGMAYRLVDRPGGEGRRPFDLIPMLLTEGEWAGLVAGLEQRARLLGALLADFYGERRTIAEGLLPPALLYANPRFLRACSGLVPAGGTHLHAYAADLVRQPDGTWRVVADRLQAPSGIGFALQSRNILARTMPEIFRSYSVRRVEPFFDAWQARLASLAPQRDRPPRIVVLTPGPFNAGFFEHVYLAQQLGGVLVEGADLTVRDDRVFIKTLGSLQPVDVILRFMEDEYCDPLELRSSSVLGVAGLLQAVRAGNVVVANALGATVVETPALRPFLPRLAQTLLGEALRLPSLETEWLGTPHALDRLGRPLSEIVFRPAFARGREEQAFAEEAARAGGRGIPEAVRRQPERFIAELRGEPSTIPVWTVDGMEPRPLTLRLFLFHDGDGYRAMPGGFVQLAQPRAGSVVPLDPPAMSKDAWVLADDSDELPADVLRGRRPAIGLPPGADELRSRTADDLFWLGRYAERLDNMARVMRSAVLRAAVDRFGEGQRVEIEQLMRLLVEARIADQRALEILPDTRGLLQAVGEACASSPTVDEIFRAIQRIAQSLRDRLSGDMWRVVLGLMREARERLRVEAQDADHTIAALDHLVTAVAAFSGMASENMTRGSGWRFLDLGRRLERGVYGASVLREVLTGGAIGEGPLGLALELFDSAITYRSRYLGPLQPGAVFSLLLADEINPRAVAFQLRAIADHLSELANSFGRLRSSPDLSLAEASLTAIRRSSVGALEAGGQLSFGFGDPQREAISLLVDIRINLLTLSETLTRVYFSHARLPQAVGYGAGGK